MPGKTSGFLQRFGEGFTFFESFADLEERSFDDRVSGSPGGDVQALKDRDAAGNEGAERASEAGDRNLAHQDSEDGQLEDDGVDHNLPPVSVPYQIFMPKMPAKRPTKISRPKILPTKWLKADDDFRREWKVNAQARKQSGENRNDLPEKQRDDGRGNADDADRVDQGGLHGGLELHVLFDVSGKALENGV